MLHAVKAQVLRPRGEAVVICSSETSSLRRQFCQNLRGLMSLPLLVPFEAPHMTVELESTATMSGSGREPVNEGQREVLGSQNSSLSG